MIFKMISKSSPQFTTNPSGLRTSVRIKTLHGDCYRTRFWAKAHVFGMDHQPRAKANG